MTPGVRAPLKIVDEILPLGYLEGLTINSRTLHGMTTSSLSCMKLLASWGLIKNTRNCDKCNVQMSFQERCTAYVDGFVWRCKFCSKIDSVRKGSFFQGSHLEFYKLIDIIYLWSNRTSIGEAKRESGVSIGPLIDWYNFIRGICANCLNDHPVQMGGPGMVVEIDEREFMRPKNSKGLRKEGHWVLGMAERGTNSCALVVVEDRTSLLLIIREHVLPKTIIITHGWSAYNRLKDEYCHDVVDHTLHFLDPRDPGAEVHANTVLGNWAHFKSKFQKMHGTNYSLFESYVQEFVWRKNFADNNVFGNILYWIRHYY
ncbi:hypothetical protein GQR58_008939 [Nymphon striatum]|nr:hypothetical protein GQR58_008939 [Nymphon striatum]